MIKEIKSILVSTEEIDKTVEKLAQRINADYAGKSIVLLIILKGSVVFASDLMRKLDIDVTLEFMQVSSYGGGSVSTGKIKITKDAQTDLNGRNVIIAEDIIDSGNTLKALTEARTLKYARCSRSRQGARRRWTLNISVWKYLMSSLSATEWTMTKNSARFLTSAY